MKKQADWNSFKQSVGNLVDAVRNADYKGAYRDAYVEPVKHGLQTARETLTRAAANTLSSIDNAVENIPANTMDVLDKGLKNTVPLAAAGVSRLAEYGVGGYNGAKALLHKLAPNTFHDPSRDYSVYLQDAFSQDADRRRSLADTTDPNNQVYKSIARAQNGKHMGLGTYLRGFSEGALNNIIDTGTALGQSWGNAADKTGRWLAGKGGPAKPFWRAYARLGRRAADYAKAIQLPMQEKVDAIMRSNNTAVPTDPERRARHIKADPVTFALGSSHGNVAATGAVVAGVPAFVETRLANAATRYSPRILAQLAPALRNGHLDMLGRLANVTPAAASIADPGNEERINNLKKYVQPLRYLSPAVWVSRASNVGAEEGDAPMAEALYRQGQKMVRDNVQAQRPGYIGLFHALGKDVGGALNTDRDARVKLDNAIEDPRMLKDPGQLPLPGAVYPLVPAIPQGIRNLNNYMQENKSEYGYVTPSAAYLGGAFKQYKDHINPLLAGAAGAKGIYDGMPPELREHIKNKVRDVYGVDMDNIKNSDLEKLLWSVLSRTM